MKSNNRSVVASLSVVISSIIIACSSSNSNQFNDDSRLYLLDSGTSSKFEAGILDLPDQSSSAYDSCISKTREQTVYPRLQLQICLDSNGQLNQVGYYDSGLDLICNWKRATDGNDRCLPLNEASSFLYSNEDCSKSLAFVREGEFYSRYVGLSNYRTDAGQHSVNVFLIDGFWYGDQMYYLASTDGSWVCSDTSGPFMLGVRAVYVGKEVDPGVFVKR